MGVKACRENSVSFIMPTEIEGSQGNLSAGVDCQV